MIGFLKGKFLIRDPSMVIVEVQGIGYEVHISLHTYGKIKAITDGTLFIYMHVKEDAHTLYGFADDEEKTMFKNLISISGVGPGTGLMVLSSLTAEEVRSAILNGDTQTIQAVKGIGGKTAQRIILELRDKLQKSGYKSEASGFIPETHNTLRNEALSALITLGISKNAAEKSIDKILKDSGHQISLEDLVKSALRNA